MSLRERLFDMYPITKTGAISILLSYKWLPVGKSHPESIDFPDSLISLHNIAKGPQAVIHEILRQLEGLLPFHFEKQAVQAILPFPVLKMFHVLVHEPLLRCLDVCNPIASTCHEEDRGVGKVHFWVLPQSHQLLKLAVPLYSDHGIKRDFILHLSIYVKITRQHIVGDFMVQFYI